MPSLMLARASGNNLRAHMSGKSDISDKKRRTVTTIETHEVWIIRKVVPVVADEAQTLVPLVIPQPASSPSSEVDDSSQTIEDES